MTGGHPYNQQWEFVLPRSLCDLAAVHPSIREQKSVSYGKTGRRLGIEGPVFGHAGLLRIAERGRQRLDPFSTLRI
jgi:hypothetical protein